MANNSAEKAVWKFSYEMWNNNWLEGTFVASQDEIDWISDQRINFGDRANKGLDVVVQMDPEYFQNVNADPAFAKQFQKTIGFTGDSPFDHLDDDQQERWELEFAETYVNGVLVKGKKPKLAYEDQDTRVVTYTINGDIFNFGHREGYSNPEGMEKFLDEFEIILPERDDYFLSKELAFEGDSFECMYVIKRKSDGQLYGHDYLYSIKHGHWDGPNGKKHGIKDPDAYVWLPVKPFVITGYKYS